MTQEDRLLEYDIQIKKILKKEEKDFNKFLSSHKEQMFKQVWDGFYRLLDTIEKEQQQNPEYKICYFQFSLLRYGMTQDIYKLLISAHNQDYFLDKNSKELEIDITWLFATLTDAGRKADELARQYMGKIETTLKYKYLMEQAFVHNKKLADLFRIEFTDMEECEPIQKIEKESYYLVKWGGYRELSETIYRIDCADKNQEHFLAYNNDNCFLEPNSTYNYQSWDETQLENIQIEKKNFIFASFKRSNLKSDVIAESFCFGTKFKEATIENCVFHTVSFERSDFRNSKMTNVAFQNCVLKNADFRGSNLENVFFTDSDMSGAVFLHEQVVTLDLDDKQRKQIVIWEGERDVFNLGRR